MNNEEIIKRIRTARNYRDISQKQIADLLGKTAPSISDLERGKVQVSASELFKIAQFLDFPIEYFFDDELIGETATTLLSLVRRMDDSQKEIFLNYLIHMEIMLNISDEIEKANPQIEEEPFWGRNIRKLRDYDPSIWRYRIGKFRVFYFIDSKERVVYILSVDRRKDAYK